MGFKPGRCGEEDAVVAADRVSGDAGANFPDVHAVETCKTARKVFHRYLYSYHVAVRCSASEGRMLGW